jgi:hypothetical protein
MAGSGCVVNNAWDDIVSSQCRPNPSILRLSANPTWVLANEPLHGDIDANTTNGVGPAMAFANVVMAEKDPTFGGTHHWSRPGLRDRRGTSISQWGRGTLLYKRLVRRARSGCAARRRDNSSASLVSRRERHSE